MLSFSILISILLSFFVELTNLSLIDIKLLSMSPFPMFPYLMLLALPYYLNSPLLTKW